MVHSPVCGDIPSQAEWEGAAPWGGMFCYYRCIIAGVVTIKVDFSIILKFFTDNCLGRITEFHRDVGGNKIYSSPSSFTDSSGCWLRALC